MDAIDHAKKRTDKAESSVLHSIDHEQAMLQCLMGSLPVNPALAEVADIVQPEDFECKPYGCIYQAMLQMDAEGETIDLLNLQCFLRRNQQFELIGGQKVLMELISDGMPTVINAQSHARKIAGISRLRKLSAALKTADKVLLGSEGRNPDETAEKISQMLNSVIDSFPAPGGGQGFQKAEDLMLSQMQDVRNRQEAGKSGITGVPTGYSDLDAVLSGLHKTDLIVIGARPGVGKTTFGMNIASNIALNPEVKKPVLFFSLEMPASQIASRLLSSVGSVDQSMLRSCNPDDEGWIRMQDAWKRFGKDNPCKLWITSDQTRSPVGIRSAIRKFIQKNGDISLIVVDYLQHMQIPGYPSANKPQEVGECSGALKAMAVEFDVPVIALAQLNRDVTKRGGKSSPAKPGLSDLRGSGDIEQDADVVMFIHRNTDDQQNDRKAEILIKKHRHGPLGEIQMQFQTEYCRYEQICNLDAPQEQPWYKE